MYFSKNPHLLPFGQHSLPKLDPKMHRVISWNFWKSIFYCRLYSNRSFWVFKLWSSEIVRFTFIFQEEFDEMLLACTRIFTARQNLNLHQLFNFLLLSIDQTYQLDQIWALLGAWIPVALKRFWALSSVSERFWALSGVSGRFWAIWSDSISGAFRRFRAIWGDLDRSKSLPRKNIFTLMFVKFNDI